MKTKQQKEARLVNRLNKHLDNIVGFALEGDLATAHKEKGRVVDLFFEVLKKKDVS